MRSDVMKIMHLSDLHLGKRVNDFSMIDDQKYILKQISTIVMEENIDVVMLCGDIYDKSIPSVEAIALFDDFLCELHRLHTTVLIISGNHDSPQRLAFGSRFFQSSQIYVSSQFEGSIEQVTWKEDWGEVVFYLLPFVKPVYVNHLLNVQTNSYEECMKYLLSQTKMDLAKTNILLAHQFVSVNQKGPECSDSETASLGGIEQMDYHLFDAFDYVALGHIHKPQAMGREMVRYCGSLLKYSFSEANRSKSVPILEIQGPKQIKLSFQELRPLHDMREITCSMEALLKRQVELGNGQDYMHVILTDEEEIIDAIGKVRTIFPNVMQITLQNRRYAMQQQTKINEEELLQQTPLALFAQFYERQNNINLSDAQWKELEKIIQEVEQ